MSEVIVVQTLLFGHTDRRTDTKNSGPIAVLGPLKWSVVNSSIRAPEYKLC